MKPVDRVRKPKLICTAAAAVVSAGLAVTVVLAQDGLDKIRLAAEQGAAEAQYNLGVNYANGHGVLKDDGEAVRLGAFQQQRRQAFPLRGV